MIGFYIHQFGIYLPPHSLLWLNAVSLWVYAIIKIVAQSRSSETPDLDEVNPAKNSAPASNYINTTHLEDHKLQT